MRSWRVWRGEKSVVLNHESRLEAARLGEIQLGLASCTAEIEEADDRALRLAAVTAEQREFDKLFRTHPEIIKRYPPGFPHGCSIEEFCQLRVGDLIQCVVETTSPLYTAGTVWTVDRVWKPGASIGISVVKPRYLWDKNDLLKEEQAKAKGMMYRCWIGFSQNDSVPYPYKEQL